MEDKINTYFGFAIKKRSIIFGIDNILKSKNEMVVFVSNDLSINSCDKLKNIGISYFVIDMPMVLKNRGVKAVAVTDKNLAEAILNIIK